MDMVQSLVQEDLTCSGGAKSMCHNYLACSLDPRKHNCWDHIHAQKEEISPQREPHAPQLKSSPCSLQLEQNPMQQQRSSTAKNTYINKYFFKVIDGNLWKITSIVNWLFTLKEEKAKLKNICGNIYSTTRWKIISTLP